jgi:coproporphyrinogen III oxidase-like Fe-S oxidoreductase
MEGVDLALARERWGSDRIRPWEVKLQSLVGERGLVVEGDRVRLSRDSCLVSNEIFQEFVSL